MSMNRTCPISTFTSGDESDGIAKHYLETRGLMNLFRSNHFLHQRLETRIATERVEQRIHFDPADISALMVSDTLVQPSNCFIVISQAKIKQHAPVYMHLTVMAKFFQFR